MTPLLDALLDLLEGWRAVFPQKRTLARAVRLALAQVLAPGTRAISRLIAACGLDQRDWSADYRVYSRSPWAQRDLFRTPLAAGLAYFSGHDHISVAGDFTHVPKTGRHIPGTFCMRDPLSPPYHVNLIHGLRFIQYTLLLPLYEKSGNEDGAPPRSVPVCFDPVPVLPKPGRKADEKEVADYKVALRKRPANRTALASLKGLRADLDEAGARDKTLLTALDAGFCNRVFFGEKIDRVELVARCRKDARLCHPAPPESRRVYSDTSFTPESVRLDESLPWKTGVFFHGGAWRTLRYKEVSEVLWQSGARRRKLRLIVLAPVPYRNSTHGKTHYRQPAFLLSTDLKRPVEALIQCYLDRWQIEVNHREEKSTFGVGDAQVRNVRSVPRQPAFTVAVYALLLLAAQKAYGGGRGEAYVPLPKWRKTARRPSGLDIVSQIRREMEIAPDKLTGFAVQADVLAAATARAAA
jgi:hypothetical protein